MSSIRATEQFRSPRTRLVTFARCGVTTAEEARPGVILAVAERAITIAPALQDSRVRRRAM